MSAERVLEALERDGGDPVGITSWDEVAEIAAAALPNLVDMAKQMRADSERWFPELHRSTLVPLGVQYALGLVGEAGEVANAVKKRLRQAEAPDSELADELADVFVYLCLLADEVGVDLLEAYERKRRLNERRWGALPQVIHGVECYEAWRGDGPCPHEERVIPSPIDEEKKEEE